MYKSIVAGISALVLAGTVSVVSPSVVAQLDTNREQSVQSSIYVEPAAASAKRQQENGAQDSHREDNPEPAANAPAMSAMGTPAENSEPNAPVPEETECPPLPEIEKPDRELEVNEPELKDAPEEPECPPLPEIEKPDQELEVDPPTFPANPNTNEPASEDGSGSNASSGSDASGDAGTGSGTGCSDCPPLPVIEKPDQELEVDPPFSRP